MPGKPFFSSLAGPGLIIALFSGLTAILAGLGNRWGIWDFRTGLTIFRWSAYGGAVAVVLSAAAVFSTLRIVRWSGFLAAFIGLVIGLALIAISARWMQIARSVPPIHDITTDTDNPPKFVAIVPLRGKNSNPLQYPGPEVARQQHRAYPDIVPLILTIPPEAAFDKAMSVAGRMGCKIVDADKAEGRIEAVATTFWFGFKDDIVIRIERKDSGSRVDIRSVSRVGVSDLGTNAGRIRGFLTEMRGR